MNDLQSEQMLLKSEYPTAVDTSDNNCVILPQTDQPLTNLQVLEVQQQDVQQQQDISKSKRSCKNRTQSRKRRPIGEHDKTVVKRLIRSYTRMQVNEIKKVLVQITKSIHPSGKHCNICSRFKRDFQLTVLEDQFDSYRCAFMKTKGSLL